MPNSVSVENLRELLASPAPPIVIDVRRQQAFADSPATIPGSLRRLPESVESWASELPTDGQIVVYCVHGHQVSQGVVSRLQQIGLRAAFLEGGIEHWKSHGGPVQHGGV
ncbi:rhodanese-like domain-containing protein [Rhizobacter sp. J219]|uniref:rhodanese-like domain-containing protein n=1 Tax=Rhizobacter sp. J219 TaxID=2898430 RepID=UPI0035B423DB